MTDVKALLAQNTTQARQMLRKLLAGSKIEMEGFGRGDEHVPLAWPQRDLIELA